MDSAYTLKLFSVFCKAVYKVLDVSVISCSTNNPAANFGVDVLIRLYASGHLSTVCVIMYIHYRVAILTIKESF